MEDATSGREDRTPACCDEGQPCSTGSPSLPRRQFLARVSTFTAGSYLAATGPAQGLPLIAGPFEEKNRYLETIPADKKLDWMWVKSLFERGEKETYSEPQALSHIGMPVGGLFAGTVYLGGDGRLWLWNIFNRDQEGIDPRPLEKAPPNAGDRSPLVRNMVRGGLNYIEPAKPSWPFQQGFALQVGERIRSLGREGFSEVTFDGRYPIGKVSYHDDGCPVSVELEAFSPFIPLNVNDSSLPVTVMSYTLTNRSKRVVDAKLMGHLQNPVCLETRDGVSGRLENRVVREDGLIAVSCTAVPPRKEPVRARPDITFDDFEKRSWDGWEVEGDAFGTGPIRIEDIPDYQGDVGGQGKRVVNSHASAPGDDIVSKDNRVGTLTSTSFKVERRFVRLLIGGGSHDGETCVDLLVDDKVVASVTGKDANRMHRASLDVRRFEGQTARLRIVDRRRGSWGNIGVDEIVFTDRPLDDDTLERQRDFGSMCLSLIGSPADLSTATASRAAEKPTDTADCALDAKFSAGKASAEKITGEIQRSVTLEPGATATVTFVLSWHFPNLEVRGMRGRVVGHSYAERFDSALAVARYAARNIERLAGDTRKWVETWYDSTLPYWLLDRTMANTSTLATTTCYRFRSGRFWAWEGIGCCPGTCTHVWHYAQALGRLFPEIERDQRERVDFGIAFHPDGGVGHRAYVDRSANAAIDGHCGRILGVLREHQMSTDSGFLKRLWPRVRKAVEWLLKHDPDADGVIEGTQHNTLDAAWYGKIPWLVSLYLATLRAAAVMANDVGDREFAGRCEKIAERGKKSILETWNGEYFFQIEDPKHPDAIGTGAGCHIDQLFGQTWAHWVGLGNLFDRDKQLGALRSLWKYNFVPDVGKFREKFPRGRWYATAGDAGLLMCTWPRGGENKNYAKHWQYGYFNECMSGFEWQAAAHMIQEGRDQPDLLEAGLAVSRAIHDRYNAALRNPYNEVECSDHYSRAMASYGVFQAVCGFESHGPRGHLAFAPRLAAESFRAAFTAAGGWGSYEQRQEKNVLAAKLSVRWGKLRLESLGVTLPNARSEAVSVESTGVEVAGFEQDGDRVVVRFGESTTITAGAALEVRVSTSE